MRSSVGAVCSAALRRVNTPRRAIHAILSRVMSAFDGGRIGVSPFVAFFHHFPRFGYSNRLRVTAVYTDSLLIAASPFLALALTCLFYAVIGRRGQRKQKLNTTARTYGSVPTTEDAQIVADEEIVNGDACTALGASLLFIAASCSLALALAANWHIWSGISTTLAVTRASAQQLDTDAHGVLAVAEQFLVRLNRQLNKHGLLKSALSLSTSFDATEALRAVRTSQANFDGLSANVRHIADSNEQYSTTLFICVVAGVVALSIALTSLFMRKRGGTRTPPLVAALAWACVALATAAALGSSDTCTSLSEFHRILKMQAKHIPPDAALLKAAPTNIFLNAGVQCPHKFAKTSIPLGQLVQSIGLLLDNKLTEVILRYVYPKSPKSERKQLRKWLTAHLKSAVSCDIMIKHVGKINNAFCAKKGPMFALFAAWFALIALATTLTLAAIVPQHPDINTWRAFVPPLPVSDDDTAAQ